jgi:raffinose/stachyose/melibiose transport system substrate-binding protein
MKKLSVILVLSLLVNLFTFAGALAQSDAVELEFLQSKVESNEAYELLIAKFMEENPDIKVDLITLSDTLSVLVSRLAIGEGPDIFNHFPLRADFSEIVRSERILPLTGEAFFDNINPEAVAMCTRDDGEIYALPLTMNTMGIYYNNELLEKYGLEIPTTYQELIAMLEQVKDEENCDFLFACKDAWTLWQMMDRRLGQEFMNSDNDFDATFRAIAAGEMKAADSPEIVAAAQKCLELFQYAQNDPFGTSFTQMCNDFATGKGIAFFQGSWAYPNIKAANPDLDFTVTAFPADEGKVSYMSMNIDIGLCLSKDGQNADAAKRFLAFMAETENAQLFNDIDGSMSLVKGVVTDIPEFKEVYGTVNQGNMYEMMSNLWPNGYNTSLMDYVSEMLLYNDLESYLENVDMLTDEFYN